ncbi:hypothetical protein RugamoR57_49830 [Duganella caerulea]
MSGEVADSAVAKYQMHREQLALHVLELDMGGLRKELDLVLKGARQPFYRVKLIDKELARRILVGKLKTQETIVLAIGECRHYGFDFIAHR